MTQILVISNPFEPLKDIQRFKSTDGLTVREWLGEHFGPEFVEFERPTVCQYNGELILREEWESRRFKSGDVVAFVQLPQGVGVLIAALVIGLLVGVVAYLLMPDPKIPGDATENGGNAVYTLRGQNNRFRPGEPIEVMYGKCRHWPTYAARPYSEYEGNQQYQYSLYCLGQGEFEIHAMRLDDTNTNAFADIETEVVLPGESVELVESAVYTSLEVSNIELLGPNEEEYTGVSGPFVLNEFANPIRRIAVDISFPGGLYKTNEEGKLQSESVELLFEYREINEAGSAIGSWTTLANPTITRNTNTPQRLTYKQAVSSGRYQIRGRRVSNKPESIKSVSQVRWETAKGYAKNVGSFGNVTMIAVKALATNSLNDSTSRAFNVIATRKVPTWTSGGGWTAPVATRNPIWAFCDIFRADYGAKLSDEFLDMPTLKALADTFETRADWFDWIFDNSLSIWEAAKMTLRVGRTIPIPQGSLITAVRDTPQTLPAAVFNQHNIIQGSLKKSLKMFSFQPYDGIIVQYTDNATWKPKEVNCVLPGRAGTNLERVNFPGCTNRNKALQEGLYLQTRREYQRKTVTFQTGLEGHIPAFMDLIAITHDTVRVGQAGMVLAYDEGTREMTLSEQVVFATEAVDHVIALRGDDGAILGTPIVVSEGSAPNKVILATDPEAALDFSLDRVPPLYAFGVADIWAFMGKVSSIRPIDEKTVEIAAVNYVSSVYEWEDETTVEAVERDVIRNPSAPVVEWVTIAPVPEKADRVFIDWLPVAGAASYILQVSFDAGASWNAAGSYANAPAEVGTLPGAMIARVATFSATGNIIWTESAEFLVGSNVTPPPAPEPVDPQPAFTGLVATAKWLAVSGANGYVVNVYADAVLLRTIAAGSALRADYDFDMFTEDTGTGREIVFEILAFNDGGNGTALEVTQTNPVPAAPSALAVGSPTGTDYPATWAFEDTGDELEFNLYASTTPGFTPGPGNLIATVTDPATTISAPTRPLYWRVGFVDVWGPEETLSDEAEIPA